MTKISSIIAGGIMLGLTTIAQASTLEKVIARDKLICGVNTGLLGFALEEDGQWKGLDVDFCRAVSAAIFGTPDKVEFKPLGGPQRFTALTSGEVDILSRNTTWTMTRDATLGVSFVGVTYYDGQGFMVKKDLGANSITDLTGTTVCLQNGSSSQINMKEYFEAQDLIYDEKNYPNADEIRAAFQRGDCNLITSDQSQLYAQRARLPDPQNYVVLDDIIAREPLGPAVRQDDIAWFTLVRWVRMALIEAEFLKINSTNVDRMRSGGDTAQKRLMGSEESDDMGAKIGLKKDWAYNIVKLVGNYGEIFERNVGMQSKLKISRGLNDLWIHGGLMYSQPVK